VRPWRGGVFTWEGGRPWCWTRLERSHHGGCPEALAPGGRIVTVGVGRPQRVENTLAYYKEARITGSNGYGVSQLGPVDPTYWTKPCSSSPVSPPRWLAGSRTAFPSASGARLLRRRLSPTRAARSKSAWSYEGGSNLMMIAEASVLVHAPLERLQAAVLDPAAYINARPRCRRCSSSLTKATSWWLASMATWVLSFPHTGALHRLRAQGGLEMLWGGCAASMPCF